MNNKEIKISDKIKKVMFSNPMVNSFRKKYKDESSCVGVMEQDSDVFKLFPGSLIEDDLIIQQLKDYQNFFEEEIEEEKGLILKKTINKF